MKLLVIATSLSIIASGCASNPSVFATRAPASANPHTLQLHHKAYLGPEEIRQLTSRQIAELLVNRLHENCDFRENSPESGDGIDSQTEVVMMIHSDTLPQIARFGFLNLHETSVTSGSVAPKRRYLAEQELSLLRIPYSSKARRLLPKYSFFNIKSDDFGRYDLDSQYGDVAVVFKDEVRKRTTWTYQDSLHIPFGFRDVDDFPARTTKYTRGSGDNNGCNYCEAQTWGELDLNDVDHFMILEGSVLPEQLKSLGIPVFSYKVDKQAHQAIEYAITGTLLAAGKNHSHLETMSIAQVQADENDPQTPKPVQNLLQNREYGFLTDDEILSRLELPAVKSEISHPLKMPESSFGPTSLFIQRDYLTAELAVRPKNDAILERLASLTDDPDDYVRVSAYYGLTELPSEKLKTYLLKCFSDASKVVKVNCVAFGADLYSSDSDIKATIDHLIPIPSADPDDDAPIDVIGDWAARVSKPKLCFDGPTQTKQ